MFMVKNKKILGVLVAVIIVGCIILMKKDLWEVNANLLKKEVLSIEQSVEEIKLTDITPFEWDVLYSFKPYVSKELIYETVGYKWDYISETVNEGMNQIVFMKDGKVVCYLYGYPENNGYGIFFSGRDDTDFVSVLKKDYDIIFQVERRDHVILLTNNAENPI